MLNKKALVGSALIGTALASLSCSSQNEGASQVDRIADKYGIKVRVSDGCSIDSATPVEEGEGLPWGLTLDEALDSIEGEYREPLRWRTYQPPTVLTLNIDTAGSSALLVQEKDKVYPDGIRLRAESCATVRLFVAAKVSFATEDGLLNQEQETISFGTYDGASWSQPYYRFEDDMSERTLDLSLTVSNGGARGLIGEISGSGGSSDPWGAVSMGYPIADFGQ